MYPHISCILTDTCASTLCFYQTFTCPTVSVAIVSSPTLSAYLADTPSLCIADVLSMNPPCRPSLSTNPSLSLSTNPLSLSLCTLQTLKAPFNTTVSLLRCRRCIFLVQTLFVASYDARCDFMR